MKGKVWPKGSIHRYMSDYVCPDNLPVYRKISTSDQLSFIENIFIKTQIGYYNGNYEMQGFIKWKSWKERMSQVFH